MPIIMKTMMMIRIDKDYDDGKKLPLLTNFQARISNFVWYYNNNNTYNMILIKMMIMTVMMMIMMMKMMRMIIALTQAIFKLGPPDFSRK